MNDQVPLLIDRPMTVAEVRVWRRQRAAIDGNGQVPVVREVEQYTEPALHAVQVVWPGRFCQRCDPGPDRQLATRTLLSSTGQGRDFLCEWHAPPGAQTHVLCSQREE